MEIVKQKHVLKEVLVIINDNKETNKDSDKSTTHTSDSGVEHSGGSKKF